jgi:hypothetical protein
MFILDPESPDLLLQEIKKRLGPSAPSLPSSSSHDKSGGAGAAGMHADSTAMAAGMDEGAGAGAGGAPSGAASCVHPAPSAPDFPEFSTQDADIAGASNLSDPSLPTVAAAEPIALRICADALVALQKFSITSMSTGRRTPQHNEPEPRPKDATTVSKC